MGEPALKCATYEDLFHLPDNVVGEIIEGELFASPRPAMPHTHSASEIGIDIGYHFSRGGGGGGRSGSGGWVILDEPELHLEGDIVVPDLAGWRQERMPVIPNTAHLTLAPDWVCEVISPATSKLDRVKKKRIYAREQVSYYWIVDPLEHTVEVYQLQNDLWVELMVLEGNVQAKIPPFQAVELDISRWWLPA